MRGGDHVLPESVNIGCYDKSISVLITAETSSSVPVNLASEIARDRAIVVAVGAVGMELQRRLYYEKELDFRVSRSYGRDVTTRHSSRRGSITRSGMSAGPKLATWKRSCNCSRMAN